MILQLGLCNSPTVLRNGVCVKRVQAGPVLCSFLLRDLALTRLENLHYFSNLHDNFRFNAIWHR